MRGPSLQKTAIISFTLHVTAFLIIVLILRQSNQMIMPSPYTVSLVGPDLRSGTESGSREELSVRKAEVSPVPAEVPARARKEIAVDKNKREMTADKDMITTKISAIAAKKNIERRVLLRSKIISLKGSNADRSAGAKTASSAGGRGTLFDDYYSMITKEIRQHWVFPEVGKKDMEAIVSVRILRDGTAIVQKIEKSSGNMLFDRSALKALAKASPLSAPPYEMEIGVRFYP